MNIVDAVSIAYVAYGAVRGRKRGLADEAYRLIRMAIAFAAGCGLYGLVSRLIGKALAMGTDVSGPLGFVITVAAAWYLLSRLKLVLTAWITARFHRYAGWGGAVAGCVRSAVIVLTIVSAFHLAGKAPGRDAVSEQSWVGRVAALCLPGR